MVLGVISLGTHIVTFGGTWYTFCICFCINEQFGKSCILAFYLVVRILLENLIHLRPRFKFLHTVVQQMRRNVLVP